ncbi:EAL domain-containing protein [Gluconacetobacter azotocaptans]|uniref:EAL domain-containing protein n=1 Tax=Gluconacetobacter azotocaptans TaxID=142834 RepID=A0A7W4JVZ4_9PROT|nr:bifunctional diguanylate cyclase/phosphodiesterase [Gluconacetobacter azotocaptans]MBB2191914.1 EAL domain-containing protein [Gluconacetobacter azotocaptans]GBQ28268.1 bacterial signalling protein GGDEF/EAL domain-containing protein [Gluconacetobacter azotocaptans DSM 13594]
MTPDLIHVHNLWLIFVAVLVCANGSWTSISLFDRAIGAIGTRQTGWQVLTAIAAGTTVWCTHFIAIIAFNPGEPVSIDPGMTMLSLVLAMLGAGLGFAVAMIRWKWCMPLMGGVGMGLAIAGMHYTGMRAYLAHDVVSWNLVQVAASVILTMLLSAAALHFAVRRAEAADRLIASVLICLALVGLHFTSVSALRIAPPPVPGTFIYPVTIQAMAIAVAIGAIGIFATILACNQIDETTREEAYNKILHMALNDSLTQLPNRESFNQRLDSEIAHADAQGARIALVVFDLDRFKAINDLWGHTAGDEALRLLADRMRATLRQDEFIARVGGDEFAAIYRIERENDLADFLSRIATVLKRPIRMGDRDVLGGGSIGVAFYPDNAADKQGLVNNADLAMYRAKKSAAEKICFYDEAMDETIRTRTVLTAELQAALEKGQFELHYQVQTSVLTGEITGYEALLRWRHPQRGVILPSEFIPLAEESGFIGRLGEWVLRTACQEATTWKPPYKVSVNLSPVQFAYPDLSGLVAAVLRQTGLDPARLELELTESTIITDKARALAIVNQIKALGVTIALDDFGTGYSSLDTLRSFPFDRIKLDRSFMQDFESSPRVKAIVRAVLALGKSLEIPILAEGIETPGQLLLLGEEGCDHAQGFFLGRPATVFDIVDSGQIMRAASLDPSRRADLPHVVVE